MSNVSEVPGDDLLVAPVTITPTKPLTPTHVKGLLWADMLVKATSLVRPVTLVWNPRMAHLTTQTTAFWHHLDSTRSSTEWSALSEKEIGEHYVRFHRERPEITSEALTPYFERVESEGWIHPASRRMLELWRSRFDLLHVADPGLTDETPLPWSAGEALSVLAERGLLIDHRRFGGPVYLDGARWGMPVRQIVGGDGHANYLLPILRALLPEIRPGRPVLLLFDDGLTSDYLLLDRILALFGARVARLALGRVPVDGKVLSSRYGGWSGSTLADISSISGSADVHAYRLGMRMYFVGLLDRRCPQSFRVDLLRRCVGRAARILALGPASDDVHPGLPLSTGNGYADSHRLAVSMFGRPAALPSVLKDVMV